MPLLLHHIALCAPLFLLVALGWASVKIGMFDAKVSSGLGRFTFKLLMPVLLFKLMSGFADMPPVDWRVLVAFFGSCAVVYLAGRFYYGRVFRTDAAGTTVLAMAGIFGNNVQLGVPIVEASLGPEAMPTISILIIFNVLLLWTVAIASVEIGRYGRIQNLRDVLKPMLKVFRTPVVLGIIAGTLWSFSGLHLPDYLQKPVDMIAMSTTPMCLIVVGMSLAQYSFSAGFAKGLSATAAKLVVQPILVWMIARMIGLGELETNACVVLSCLPVAINVFLMSQDFGAEEGAASNGIFVSTFLSALTVPLTLTILGVAPNL